jgi:hypothetical protein
MDDNRELVTLVDIERRICHKEKETMYFALLAGAMFTFLGLESGSNLAGYATLIRFVSSIFSFILLIVTVKNYRKARKLSDRREYSITHGVVTRSVVSTDAVSHFTIHDSDLDRNDDYSAYDTSAPVGSKLYIIRNRRTQEIYYFLDAEELKIEGMD